MLAKNEDTYRMPVARLFILRCVLFPAIVVSMLYFSLNMVFPLFVMALTTFIPVVMGLAFKNLDTDVFLQTMIDQEEKRTGKKAINDFEKLANRLGRIAQLNFVFDLIRIVIIGAGIMLFYPDPVLMVALVADLLATYFWINVSDEKLKNYKKKT